MKHHGAGLVCAGGVNRTFVARMPTLLASIALVKAASVRVARRIANSLGAGRPVESYTGLTSCNMIWIAVPDFALEQVLGDLAGEKLLAGAGFILCDSMHESACMRPLRAASINAVFSSGGALAREEGTLVAEGDAGILRYLRRVAEAEKRKLIEIRTGSKALFIAGTHFAAHLTLPWIAAAVESLRAAGFSRLEATRVVEELATRTLRAYGKAGSKAWRPSAAAELRRALNSRLPDARLNLLYRDGIEHALEFFKSGAQR